MKRRRIPDNIAHKSNRRLSTSDINDLQTPQGASKVSDEFRRITIKVNELDDKLQQPAGAESPSPATTTKTDTGGGKPPKPPVLPTPDKMQIWENHRTKVDDAIIWDFTDSASVTFTVTKSGRRGIIQAFVEDTYDLSVGHGGNTGPALEFVESPLGFVNRVNTHLLWFGSDAASYEGGGGHLGLHGDLPTLDAVTLVTKKDAPLVPTNPYYGQGETVLVKTRVTPLLHVWDDYTENILATNTTEHTTRMEFVDGTNTTVRVSPHGTYQHAVEIELNVNDDLYEFHNLGVAASNHYEVFKERIGYDVYYRRIKKNPYVVITQDADYIYIGGYSVSGTVDAHVTEGTNQWDVVVDERNVNVGGYYGLVVTAYSEKSQFSNYTEHYIKSLRGINGTTLINHDEYIEISSEAVLHYSAASLSGTGRDIYVNTTGTGTSGDPYTLNFRKVDGQGDVYDYLSGNSVVLESNLYGENVGGEVEVYKSKRTDSPSRSNYLQFRTFVGSNGVDVYSTTNTVEVVGVENSIVQKIYVRHNNSIPATYSRHQLDFIDTNWAVWTITDDNTDDEVEIELQPKVGFSLDGGTVRYRRNLQFITGANVTLTEDYSDSNEYRITIESTGGGGGTADAYTGANLGGEVGNPYISTTGSTPTYTHNFRTIGAYDSTITVQQIGNTIMLQANTDMVDMDNVGGYYEVYKDYTDTGSSRTFHIRTIQSSNGSILITQNTNDIDVEVNDTFSIITWVEFPTSPDSYNIVDSPMRELRFSHYFNRSGFTVAPDDFDSLWIADTFPTTANTRVKLQVPNPLQAEHQNSVGGALFTTNIGQRKFIFQDNSAITFGVSETTDADGYRQSIIVANFTDEAVVTREYAIDNIGGYKQVYKNYTDAGSLRTFHLRTFHSSDGSIIVDENTNDIDLRAIDTYDLSVGYGGSTGPTLNFAGATMGVVNQVDTRLMWFAGDNASFEGGGGALGLHGDLPAFDVVFLVDNNDAPWVVGNPYYGLTETVRVKARVTPLFHAWDDYTESTLLVTTTDHLTRMEFVDTATVQARVSQHGTYTHGVKVELSVKEGTSVQSIRVRQNSTGTGNSQPRINLIDNNYSVWTLTNDTVDNEHDISIQPKLGFKLDNGSLAYRKDVKFITGTGVTLTEDVTNADEYRITITRPFTVKDDGVTVVANTVETINFNDSTNDITTIVSLDADPKRVNVTSQFCGYGTKWDTPLFCDPTGEVNYITNFVTATWSYPIWFDQELTEDTQGWVENPTSPSPKWQFKPSRKGRYHVHVFVRFRVADPTNNALPVRMDLPQLAVFKNGAMDTMLDADEMSVRFNEMIAYAINNQDWSESLVHPISTFTLHGGTTMQLNANDYIEFKLRHQTGADKYVQLLYGWCSIDYVGRCNDTLATPTATYFTDP